MPRNRTARIISILIMVAAALYLIVSLVAAWSINRGGLGEGWGTGWRGWLTLPLLISAFFGSLSLFVFGAVLLFLGEIANNTRDVRLSGRVWRRREAALTAETAALPVGLTGEPRTTEPALAAAAFAIETPVIEAEPVVALADFDQAIARAEVQDEGSAVEVRDELETGEPTLSSGTDYETVGPVEGVLPQVEVAEGLSMDLEPAAATAEIVEERAAETEIARVNLPEAVVSGAEEQSAELVSAGDFVAGLDAAAEARELPEVVVETPDVAAEVVVEPLSGEPVSGEPVTVELVAGEPEPLPVEPVLSPVPDVEAALDYEAVTELPRMDVAGDKSPEEVLEASREMPAAEVYSPDEELLAAVVGEPLTEAERAQVDLGLPEADIAEVADQRLPEAELLELEPEVELLPVVVGIEETPLERAEFELPEENLQVAYEAPSISMEEVAALPEVDLPKTELEVADEAPSITMEEVAALPEVDLPKEALTTAFELPSVFVEDEAAAGPQELQIAQPEMDIPRVDSVTETAAEDRFDSASTPVGEYTETELPATPARTSAEPQAPPIPAGPQDEVLSLRALVAQLSERLARIEGTAATPAANQTVEPATQEAEPRGEGNASPNRLPGADEAARIAAEMAAAAPARKRAPRSADAPKPAVPEDGDDLGLIDGIGPTYVQRLRAKGIRTFAALADASYEVLDEVTNGNLERVLRQDWRGQARRFAQRKANE